MAKKSPQIIAAWIGGGCAVVAAIITATVIVINAPEKEAAPGRLEITDILVDSYRKDFNAVLDFRVMNRGEKTMSISRLRLKALSIREVATAGGLDFSAKYDLDISDVTKIGETREISISHTLDPGETDRFAVNLTARKMPVGLFRLWQFEPTIVTSEGEVSAKPIDIGLPWDIRKTNRHPYFSDEAKGVLPEAN